MSRPDTRAITHRPITRRDTDGRLSPAQDDALAVEEPLEIRVAGDTLGITMRTPGQDRQLAVGLAFAEGVLTSIDELGRVYHCGKPGTAEADNTIEMLPAPGCHLDPDTAARTTLTTAACGVCGRQTIDDLLKRCLPLDIDSGSEPEQRTPIARLLEGVEMLSHRQPSFHATGATHAALVIDGSGEALTSAEDVGRHNAVDKTVGTLLLAHNLPAAHILVVSGRVSFEIVQKAVVARIPIIVGVSAPTSLAVDLADRMDVTLAGFVRDGAINLYTHAERIVL